MRGECYSILAALCIAAGLGSQGGFAAAHESEVESNWRDDSVTQLWIHGAGRIPEQAAELGAQGLRFIHNLRAGPPQSAEAILARYADAGVGLCLTLRWADSAEQSAISKTDTPPSAEESAAAIADLLVVLNSESARRMEGRLWVQFYNEYLGGPGTFDAQHDDQMFQFATDAARRIRSEAPYVRISGPALIATDILGVNERNLRPAQRDRQRRMLRGIRWSIQYADAVDVHLHTDSGASAARTLDSVREAIRREPGGEHCGLVVWEWSCAKFPRRDDAAGVRNAIVDIWNAIVDARVVAAAYGGMWPPKGQPEYFQWKNLLNEEGRPNEPVFSTFKELALASAAGRRVAGDGSGGDAGANVQKVKRARPARTSKSNGRHIKRPAAEQSN